MSDLTTLTIADAAPLLARRELSPVALAEAHLARIDRVDPQLNCFISRTPELALEQARAAEAALLRGERRGLLHGIPLALKDLYDTRGVRTTAGTRFFADRVPDADATAVARLAAQGAVLLGKLNMHEWALGLTNENPHYGACHNPWDKTRITGGSSGGSAAALAAGLCMGSLGSDTGGSIRVPASLCGVVGLKPTYGRVSLHGVVPLSWNLDHAGPMARRVEDVALLLQAIAGYDPRDPVSADVVVDDYLARLREGVRGLRIGVVSGSAVAEADPQVTAAVRRAAEQLGQLGAHLRDVELRMLHDAAPANRLMVESDAAAFHRDRLRSQPELFGPDVLARMERGAMYTSTEYVLARRTQAEWRRSLELVLAEVELLLLPTTPVAAPQQGSDAVEAARTLTRFTAPFNLARLPALSLPCGFNDAGLPIGLQIVGRPWAEATLLRAAYAYEQATDWHIRRPPLAP